MLPGFPQSAIAVAVLLSSIVRQIRSGSVWYAVDQGEAQAEHLRELTGINDRDRLLEAFGPPRMDGVWPVTRMEVKKQRTGLGYMMGDRWLDGACTLIALICLFPVWPVWQAGVLLETCLWLAGLYQMFGWFASISLLRRR
jgi:hypothetical protein